MTDALNTEPLFLGIDGGGTRTRARLADAEGRVLGEATAGPGNARLLATAFESVVEAANGTVREAGLDETALPRIHAGLGLAGIQDTNARDFILGQPHPFASIALDTDAYVAFLGAHGGRDGAILILGTGAAGFAVVGDKRITVSGWGAEIGDEGSAMMFGRTAVRRALWAFDGLVPMTPLAEAVLDRFDRDPMAAVTWASTARPTDYGTLAPLVFAHAARRDPIALAIIDEAAEAVCRLIDRFISVGASSVAMIGSVFPELRPWLPPPYQSLCVEAEGDALDGALLMARQSLAERTSP